MSKFGFVLGVCASVLVTGSAYAGMTVKEAIVDQTYQEAFCRSAQPGELKHWGGRSDWTTKASLVDMHRQYIRGNASVQDDLVKASYREVFRREPTSGELTFWRGHVRNGLTCAEVKKTHREHQAKEAAQPKQAAQPKEAEKLKASAPLMEKLRKNGYTVDAMGNITKNGSVVVKSGGYVIGQNGAGILSHNGAQLVGPDGASLIGNDAGSFRR